jgi:hypothetical protein
MAVSHAGAVRRDCVHRSNRERCPVGAGWLVTLTAFYPSDDLVRIAILVIVLAVGVIALYRAFRKPSG